MTNHDLKKNYLDYVSEVLGVKTLMSAQENTPSLDSVNFKKSVSGACDLLVRVQDLNTYSNAEKELLGKMLAALKLAPERIQIISFSAPNTAPATGGEERMTNAFLLDLVNDLAGIKTDLQNTHVVTYSPRVLLQQAEHKQKAWEELKKIIQFFAS